MTDPNAPPVDPNQAQAGTNRVVQGATAATIDQANQAMRVMPWYQDMLHGWGMSTNAGQAPTLNDSQRQQLLRAAQAHGFQVDEGHMNMDAHGNFHNNGHALRNTLIVVGLAAATIATMGAAGMFSGPAAAAIAGGEGAAAGTTAATTAATLAGIEGATAGVLSPAAIAGLGATTAIPALAGTAAAIPAVAGATTSSILPTAGTVAGTTSSVLPSVTGGSNPTGGLPYDPYANPGGTGPNGTISGSGLGGPSILSQAGQYGRALAPVLGRMAGANAQGQQQNFNNTAGLAEAALAEPGTHLANIKQSNTLANGPVVAHWNGPGSGLRGEIPYYTGGKFAPLSPDLQSQMPQFQQSEMQKLLHPTLDPASNPKLQPNGSDSAWDKILGGAGFGASILASGGKF